MRKAAQWMLWTLSALIGLGGWASQLRAQSQPQLEATFQSRVDRNPAAADRIRKANVAAARLLRLDNDARRAFSQQHRQILPELQLRLPKATAAAFDWCNLNKVSDAHEQLSSDCWAVAAVEALECSYLIRNGRRLTLSPQPLLDYMKQNTADVAGDCPTAFDFFLKTGTTLVKRYPYTGHPAKPLAVALPGRAVAWGYVARDEQAPSIRRVKEALLQFGPLATGILCTPKLIAYSGGVFDEPNPSNPNHVRTNHAMVIVGWDDSRGPHGAWKVKGTWGAAWGEEGYMWISYGSNNVAYDPVWVRTASMFYALPTQEFAQLVPGTHALPAVHFSDRANHQAQRAISVKDSKPAAQ